MFIANLSVTVIVIIIPSAAILCIRPSPSVQHSNFVNVSYYYLAVIQVQKSCTNRKINVFYFYFYLYLCITGSTRVKKEKESISPGHRSLPIP